MPRKTLCWSETSSKLLFAFVATFACTVIAEDQKSFEEYCSIARDPQVVCSERNAAADAALELAIASNNESDRFAALLASAAVNLGSDTNKFTERLAEATKYQKNIADAKLQSEYYRLLGYEASQKGDYAKAVELLRRGQSFVRQPFSRSREFVRSELMVSVYLRRLGMFEEAIDSAERVHELATEGKHPDLSHFALNNLAFWLLEWGRLDQAEDVYETIPTEASAMLKLAVDCGFADIQLRRGQPTVARTMAEKILEEADPDIVPSASMAIVELLVARCQAAEELWQEAETACKKAIEGLQNGNRTDDAKLLLGTIFIETNREEEGIGLIAEVAEKANDVTIRKKAYAALSEQYVSAGDFQAAYECEVASQRFWSSHLEIASAVKVATIRTDLERQRELQRLQSETNKAKLSSELAEQLAQNIMLESAAATRSRNSTIAIAGFFLFGTFVFTLFNLRWKHEKLQKEQEQELNLKLKQVVEKTSAELLREFDAKTELEKSLERVRRAEAIGHLTGCVAHDFNNLLQVVFSANELLENHPDLTQLERQILSASSKSAEAGASVIRQLMAYARRQNLTPEPFAISEYFSDVSSLLLAAIDRKCSLTVKNEAPGLTVILDSSQLTTALINMLRNSVDAMPDGGQIEIWARAFDLTENETDEWSDVPPGKYLRLAVTDEGTGMDASERLHAFEPFYSTKDAGNGSGLGLSSVYGFVKQSGGDIRLGVSTTGGTRVEMIFPVSHVELPAKKFEEPPTNIRCSVLLVEDDPEVGNSLLRSLECVGYKCQLVDQYDEAISRIEGFHDFDLVLSDVQLQGERTGIELAYWIRSQSPDLKVVLMSGYSDAIAKETPFIMLQKPFSLELLIKTISTELRESTQASGKNLAARGS